MANPIECLSFANKQAYVYVILLDTVLTPTGKRIVEKYKDTSNAQQVLVDLLNDATKTITGYMNLRNLHDEIVTAKMGPSHKGRQHEWVLTLLRKLDMHNDLEPHPARRITDDQAKVIFETAVSDIPNLRDITLRDVETNVARGLPPLDYRAYILCLETAAQLHDSTRSKSMSINRA